MRNVRPCKYIRSVKLESASSVVQKIRVDRSSRIVYLKFFSTEVLTRGQLDKYLFGFFLYFKIVSYEVAESVVPILSLVILAG